MPKINLVFKQKALLLKKSGIFQCIVISYSLLNPDIMRKFSFQKHSFQRRFMKNGVLKNFAKFTRKHVCLFFNKVASLRPATLLKKRLWQRYFPANFAKFVRTTFLQNTSERLLLSFLLPTDLVL